MYKLILLGSLILIPRFASAAPGVFCPCEDKQIVAQLQASSSEQLALANAVLPRLQDERVIAFAQTVVINQTDFNQRLTKFINDTGIVPNETDLSKAYQDETRQKIAEFKILKGSSLDQNYIETEFNDDQKLITAYDTYWILKVLNSDLKTFLEGTRPLIQSHFDEVQSIRTLLKGATVASSASGPRL